MEQTYNSVKDYVYRGVNAFERVLTNIGLLTAAGIHVDIRLNVDKHNMGEMAALVKLLHQRYGTSEHLTVYSHELYGERAPEENAELFAQRMQLKRQIAACGYKGQRLLGLQRVIRLNQCMADDDKSVQITPDGHLSKCEHYIDCEFFGHIDSEERNEAILRKFKERQSDIEACANCPYYPQCIRLVMCPLRTCTLEYQQERLDETKEGMKYEYERFLQ